MYRKPPAASVFPLESETLAMARKYRPANRYVDRHCRSPLSNLSGSLVRTDSTRLVDPMTVRLHRGDLPDPPSYTESVAIDTETMGLHPHRDRLCVVQLSNGDGSADIVQIPRDHTDAPNLKALF